ncbi:uncharacterized protein LOC127253878 [Andrographis paniculata]|uniref:uncharacterized protein LOC127253878 n=1 Tax=Andrographis paniculata TaxID=175694 RepID=UPI0021E7B094|nr:uncharacterized protein LOC127253878 [Andrographis paniculata]
MDSSAIDELPAVRALGLLFKLTEIHLWDSGLGEVQESSSYYQVSNELVEGDEKRELDDINGFSLSQKDFELAEKLNELGLPLSFCSNKERKCGMNYAKKKSTRKNNQKSRFEINDHMLDSTTVSEESTSPACLVHTSNATEESEILNLGIIDVDDLSKLALGLGDSLSLTAQISQRAPENSCSCNTEASNLGFNKSLGPSPELGNSSLDEFEHLCENNNMMPNASRLGDGALEGFCLINEGADKQAVKEITEGANSAVYDDPGEWLTYWDDFHMRTYFYNISTHESTWDPPAGMEHLVYCNVADELAELENAQAHFAKYDGVEGLCDQKLDLDLAKDSGKDNGPLSQEIGDSIGSELSTSNDVGTQTIKRKKRVRRKKLSTKSSSSEDYQGILQELPSISKYWCQRYLLFSKFDYGIRMDEEGWFSVTPESLAKHHAAQSNDGSIVDFFTGVGGNAIQFARRCKHVIAVDIDPKKIEFARHNASLYGVDSNIDFINGDSFSLAAKLKADTVFMSPPWGGPDYSKVKKFDLTTMLKPLDGQSLFDAGKKIASKMIMFLPRNVDVNQLAELSLSANPPWSLEVEQNFLNGRLKGVTAYFSKPQSHPSSSIL